ncbi:MAG: type I pullulanase, partial [Acetatifactor sp.]|nr:type I pullulanase [Acetatifactor sp.]
MDRFQYSREFDEKYAYEGKDLGAACTPRETEFKLWAPFADRVQLCLYGDGDRETAACRVLDMEREERGVWKRRLEGDFHGYYYDYRIQTGGESLRTADPYAVGCGCNGYRSMAVDLRRTDPEGFEKDKAPGRPVENIIYELHIKDFSYDADSGIPQAYRGKYKAFTVQAEETEGNGKYPTGVAYLKELGITHVHLLPFYDYGWLDEEGGEEQFSWGYDPVNYNVPEGSYATDAHDGTVRIRECKEMIQALHRAGIRVIMDVVYNHTQDADSWLERTAPGYYCRRLEDGSLSNGSACGSDIAIGRRMVDNYIANSVMYWAREYHLDGFRFDLMGLMTVELMNRIRQEMDQEFGKGEKLLYGEPWRAAESPMEEETRAALKENIRYLDKGIAVFSDDTRDVIKGHVFYGEIPGFVNGGQGLEEKVLQAVTGWCGDTSGQRAFRPKSCSQVVNYVSAHDNFTLWDKLVVSLHGQGADFATPYEDVLSANKLAALIYFTCQGNLFLQAGEEFGRTKLGDGNSYRSDPGINMLRWRQTVEHQELVAYYKGLIRLRKRLPGLCDKSADAAGRILEKKVLGPGAVAFRMDNRLREQQ